MLSRGKRSKLVRSTLFLLAIFSSSLILESTAGAEQLTQASAINKAGRQRMLSQRMVKTYCQVGMNVRADEAAAQLRSAIELFDVQLAELKAYPPNQEIATALDAEEADWKPVKDIVTKPYSKEGALVLAEKSEALLKSSHRVVLLLEQASGKPTAKLVNVSGRQRMLSQRIAKFYMLREVGMKDAAITDGLKQAVKEFREAHEFLKNAPENTDEIRKILNKAEIQWILLDYSLNNDKAVLAEFVAMTTNKILGDMDLATQRYEALQDQAR